MRRRPVFEGTVAALALFLVWWVAVEYVDGALAAALPYHRYEVAALLYPAVYYPGLPGWILASVQPSSLGVWAALAGWMVLLSVGLGAGSARLAAGRGTTASRLAAAAVVALFVTATVVEAIAAVVA